MDNRTWECWVIAFILAAALWAGGSAKGDEAAGPTAFNSRVAFNVYAVTGEGPPNRMTVWSGIPMRYSEAAAMGEQH